MKTTLLNINFRTTEYTTREETLNGRVHIVVPVIMMQDGIHSGSGGALYHSIEELGRPDWNGVPVVINHPQLDGAFVSANSESVVDTDKVGVIRNTRVDGEQLKAEAWLDVTKMAAHQPSLLGRIQGGEIIDVSVGVFTENIEKSVALENGDTAAYVATNHIPDHLAILPFETGACSVDDGCGLRVNAEDKSKMKIDIINNEEGGKEMNLTEVIDVFKGFKKNDLSANHLQGLIGAVKEFGLGIIHTNVCNECLQTNEAGILEQLNLVRRHLDSMDNDMATYYLEEMNNDGTIIYRAETRNHGNRSTSLYRQKYSIGDDNVVTFSEAPMRVTKKVSYEDTVNAMKRTKFNINEKEDNMTKVETLSAALIVNKDTKFVEGDKEWLETLSEEQLERMAPEKVEPKKEVQTNAIEALSAEDKSALEFGKQQLKAHRDTLISTITTNTAEGVWDAKSLNGMDNDTLERIAKTVPAKEEAGVYVNGGGTPVVNTAEVMYPTGIEIEKETK